MIKKMFLKLDKSSITLWISWRILSDILDVLVISTEPKKFAFNLLSIGTVLISLICPLRSFPIKLIP